MKRQVFSTVSFCDLCGRLTTENRYSSTIFENGEVVGEYYQPENLDLCELHGSLFKTHLAQKYSVERYDDSQNLSDTDLSQCLQELLKLADEHYDESPEWLDSLKQSNMETWENVNAYRLVK